jgi:Flp pilus assembly protein TadB
MILIIMLVVLVLLIGGLLSLARGRSDYETDEQSQAWQRAVQSENSIVGRVLLGVSRPLARMPRLYEQVPSRQYKALQSKLLASGAFGGDVEVYIATQAGAIFLGLAIVVVGAVLLHSLMAIAVLILGLAIAAYPYNIVSKRFIKRTTEVSYALPEFAELLQMPLTIGQGIMPALRYTAEHLDGPVAEEVRNMLTILAAGTTSEADAFSFAGERLGTPEARAFFQALLQALLEGTRVSETIAAQAESLRISTYQLQRIEVKKLPIKMVIMFGIHFLPLLFIVALVPTFYSLSHF